MQNLEEMTATHTQLVMTRQIKHDKSLNCQYVTWIKEDTNVIPIEADYGYLRHRFKSSLS